MIALMRKTLAEFMAVKKPAVRTKKATVAIVGLGYVGLPLSLLAADKGYGVIGVDIDTKKINLLKKRTMPFKEETLTENLKTSTAVFTNDFGRAKDASIYIICVPTPVYDDYTPNLEPVEGASRGIAPLLKKGDLVILESTVNPGVSESVVMPILEKISGLKCGKDFHLAHCPERINPGDPRYTVANINRVVGASDPEGLEQAAEFYESLISGSVMRMGSLKEAEAVKVVENSFRDINIAFVNELARSFAVLGIDTVRVIDGAATKPFAFMAHYPGAGVGGHCIPVDPYYLIEHAKKNGFHHDFLALARHINNGMPEYLITVVVDALNEKGKSLKGSKIAVLGVAYKANIDDARESPSFHIIKLLKARGATVEVHDPFVPAKSTKSDITETIKGADAVVIATAHSVFKELSPAYFQEHGVDVIVDGRNCLNKDTFLKEGITYRGIGR